MKQLGLLLISVALFGTTTIRAQQTMNIDTNSGHEILIGSSGFNVRIADKVWNYTHPDFRSAVEQLKPGWLRFYSGTIGDAFNSATGRYDEEYAYTHDESKQFLTALSYSEIKGPARLTDLYQLLGDNNARLIITVNAFTETPEKVGELARFCKNNNIIVEAWQFCNEPYFYVPHRNRYWWNDGTDYALKMKSFADEIQKTFPDANLALNCTWDGIWGFMKEINKYQTDNGHYWNMFSKHSYAPHTGANETFDQAYRRVNSKIIEATSPNAMAEIETWSWKGVPMLITEFGVWNRSVNGIVSAIYNAEYTLRQLQHPNTRWIGSHEISNKCEPAEKNTKLITDAYKNHRELNTDSIRTGTFLTDEGKALQLVHTATSNADYTWNATISDNPKVPAMKDTLADGMYARAFRGIDGNNYLLVTNRSAQSCSFGLNLDNKPLDVNGHWQYMASTTGNATNIPLTTKQVNLSKITIPAFSVNLYTWKSHLLLKPTQPRIYSAAVTNVGVAIKWWNRHNASKFVITCTDTDTQKSSITTEDGQQNSTLLSGLAAGHTYCISVQAINNQGTSETSNQVNMTFQKPVQPKIIELAPFNTTATLYWHSVSGAQNYLLKIESTDGSDTQILQTGNVFGFRMHNLTPGKTYHVSIAATNGLGTSSFTEPATFVCRTGMPLPVHDVSANENADGSTKITWTDNNTEPTMYRIYGGNEPYKLQLIADSVTTNTYTDRSTGQHHFYTVKTFNQSGKSNVYPNVATIIKRNKKIEINVDEITQTAHGYEVRVSHKNIKTDGETRYGIAISNISYLTVEETKLESTQYTEKSFTVLIPNDLLTKGQTYSVKAYVETNGSPIFSEPPYKNFKAQ